MFEGTQGMVRFASVVFLGLAATTASADECPTFGLDSAYLSELFCQQLRDVRPEATRSARPDAPSVPTDTVTPDADWLELQPIAEAWRSDPAKTLRLIERIRNAGGRPVN